MKKRTKLGVSLALVGILAVGGTYAYLQFQTGPVENTFTFGDNVNGEIKEPHWDGECFEGETCDIEAQVNRMHKTLPQVRQLRKTLS